MFSADEVAALTNAPWFTARWSSAVVLDTDLRIRAVNDATLDATGYTPEQLQNELLFDVFPDDPDDPGSDGAAAFLDSFQTTLRTGRRQWLGFQRYDVPDPSGSGRFEPRFWSAVHAPVRRDGRLIGIVNHAQDLTALVRGPVERVDTRAVSPDLERAASLLEQQFPGTPESVVLSTLLHSHRVVLDTIGAMNVPSAADLARLRLEVRSGRAALPPASDL